MHRAHALHVDVAHVVFDDFLHLLQATQFYLVGRVVVQIGRGCAGAGAEDEAERVVKVHIVHELDELLVVFLGLARKAHDKVRAHRHIRANGAQLFHRALVFHGGVAALHSHQNAVAAMLHGQVQMAHQLRHLGVHINQTLCEFVGVACGVTDALDTGNFGHVLDHQRKVGNLSCAAHRTSVRVDVLAQERDFFHALCGQAGHFHQHVVKWAAHLFAAGVRHHAVAAILATAFHDAHVGAAAFDASGGQVVKLFNLRKADIHLRTHERFALVQQLRQAVQSLRAKHHVHIGRAGNDGGAFLAGHAAAHGNLDAFGLQMLDAAEVGEHLFLGFFAHRTGVEDDQVSLFDIVGFFVTLGLAQHVDHLVRVVLVHLATEGFDKDFAAHGRASLLG